MFNSNNNDNSMLWLLIILFMLSSNNQPMPTEKINEIFKNGIGSFLENNKAEADKADTGSLMWQLKELYAASKGIKDVESNAKVLSVAMDIMKKIELEGNCCCNT